MAGKTPFQDDGRTIADMSDVPGSGLSDFFKSKGRRDLGPAEETSSGWPFPEAPYTPREKRMFVFAALKASLLIGLAFLAGLALVILLLQFIWNVL